MEDKEYKDAMKKAYLSECIFNDVFSRFYHQLVNQGDVVIKDFFSSPEKLAASIIDAVVESFMQRMTVERSQDKFASKIYDEIFDSPESMNLTKIDTFHDINKTIALIRHIVDVGMSIIDIKDFEDTNELIKDLDNKKQGDYEPIFMEPDFAPAFIPREVKPVK